MKKAFRGLRVFHALALTSALFTLGGCFEDWKRGTRVGDGALPSDNDAFAGGATETGPLRDSAGERPESGGDAIPGSNDGADGGDGPSSVSEAGRDVAADGPSDAPVVLTDAADAPADDGGSSPDACSCPESKNPCAESVCVDGQCQARPKPNKTTCEKGLCWEGECCTGCIADGKCEGGTTADQCGAGGAECARCDDRNECTTDICKPGGTCGETKLNNVSCKDGAQAGVCVEGTCTCGGAGQPCCSGATDCRDGLKCLGGTCGECGSAGKPCCPGAPTCTGSSICVGRVAAGASGACQKCGDLGDQCCDNGQCTVGVCDKTSNKCTACGEADQLCCKGGACKNDGLLCTTEGTCKVCGGQGQPCCAGNAPCTSDGNLCNGQEVCDGQICKRTNVVTCGAPGQCHERVSCDPTTGACFPTPKANGTACNDSDACTRTDTCQGGLCTGTNPVVCTTSNQCESPGTCSPATGTCSAPTNKAEGTSCDDGDTCTGNDKCSAGNCAGTKTCVCAPSTRRCAGLVVQVCSATGQWVDEPPCPYACSLGACTKKEQGAPCNGQGECQSGACVDGFCCNSACDDVCRTCGAPGKLGLCTAVRSGDDDTCKGERTCNLDGGCRNRAGGECKFSTDCAAGWCVDGKCCQQSACGTCQSCSGSGGTCADIKGADDVDSCAGTCDPSGACKTKQGQACQATLGGCIEGTTCVDGYCCNQACSGQCMACDLPGSLGVCTPVASGNPHGTRPSCGSGMCAGACAGRSDGLCSFPTGNCGSGPTCSGKNSVIGQSTCMSGSCVPPAEEFCSEGYLCRDAACRTSCTNSDADCVATHFCAITSANTKACRLDAQAIDAGGAQTCALIADGKMTCWGEDESGQLGDDAISFEGATPVPVRVVGLTGVREISTGTFHTCALRDTGKVYCWGYDAYGQLGDDDSFANHPMPVEVAGLSSVKAISAGGVHTCALLESGKVNCWGSDYEGQLGDLDDSFANRPTPVEVHGIYKAKAISAGGTHTCALLVDGNVACWGDNSYGQLGDGGSSPIRPTPEPVVGLPEYAKAISAGGDHTCALLESGKVSCWGRDSNGQLGNDEDFTKSPSPVAVLGLAAVRMISAGGNHTCAVLDDGRVTCWGGDSYGELGDGEPLSSRPTPVVITGLSGADAIAAGKDHTCALLRDGSVVCWGRNTRGQGGDNTTSARPSPVSVWGW